MKGKLTLVLLIVFVAGGVAYASRRDAVVAVKPSPLFAKSLSRALAQFDGRSPKRLMRSASLSLQGGGGSTFGGEATCDGAATCDTSPTCLAASTCWEGATCFLQCSPTLNAGAPTCLGFPTCIGGSTCFLCPTSLFCVPLITTSGLWCPTNSTDCPSQTQVINCTFDSSCGGIPTQGSNTCGITCVQTCSMSCPTKDASTCQNCNTTGTGCVTQSGRTCASEPTCNVLTCNATNCP